MGIETITVNCIHCGEEFIKSVKTGANGDVIRPPAKGYRCDDCKGEQGGVEGQESTGYGDRLEIGHQLSSLSYSEDGDYTL